MRAGADVEWQGRAAALADELVRAGQLTDPAWRRVFAQVPRHVFVPHFAWTEESPQGTRYRLVSRDDPTQREAWLNGVYSDATLLTQVDGRPVEEVFAAGAGYGRHSSSSTAPRLMSWMLQVLDPTEGDSVLEVGTGTGYNAALLSARLGDDHVTTVDIDEHLVGLARKRLACIGYRPFVVAADGRAGCWDNAPYDRVIATCGLPYVPQPWIDQTRPGGRLLTNLTGLLGGAMLLAEVEEGGRASGGFLAKWAGFMPSRHADRTAAHHAEECAPGRTLLDPAVLDDQAFAFLAQLHLPGVRKYWATREDGRQLFGLLAPDTSWAEVYEPDGNGERDLEQGGPRRLWNLLEQAYRLWLETGRPDWTDFSFRAEPGRQIVSLDTPAPGAGTWRLPLDLA